MSRVIHVKGRVFIANRKIAIDVIKEARNGIYFENNQFLFKQYDAYDQISERQKAREMEQVEQEYLRRVNLYEQQKQQAALEQKRLAELEIARLKLEEQQKAIALEQERIRLAEEQAKQEQQRIAAQKEALREEKAMRIIANAKKQGYKIKKELRKDNTIKLVLQKRSY